MAVKVHKASRFVDALIRYKRAVEARTRAEDECNRGRCSYEAYKLAYQHEMDAEQQLIHARTEPVH